MATIECLIAEGDVERANGCFESAAKKYGLACLKSLDEGNAERAKGCIEAAVKKYEQAIYARHKKQLAFGFSYKTTYLRNLAILYRKMACILPFRVQGHNMKTSAARSEKIASIDWSKVDDIKSTSWMNDFLARTKASDEEFVIRVCKKTWGHVKAGDKHFERHDFIQAYIEYSHANNFARKAILGQDQAKNKDHLDELVDFNSVVSSENVLQSWIVMKGDEERAKGCLQAAIEKYEQASYDFRLIQTPRNSSYFFDDEVLLERKTACLYALVEKDAEEKDILSIDWSEADDKNSTWLDEFEPHLYTSFLCVIKSGDKEYNRGDSQLACCLYGDVIKVAKAVIKRKKSDTAAIPSHPRESLEDYSLANEGDEERAKGRYHVALEKYKQAARDFEKSGKYDKMALASRKMTFLFALLAKGFDPKNLPELDWSKVDDTNSSTWRVESMKYLSPDTQSMIVLGDDRYTSKDYRGAFEAYSLIRVTGQAGTTHGQGNVVLDTRKVPPASAKEPLKAMESTMEDLRARVTHLATRLDDLNGRLEIPEMKVAALPSKDGNQDKGLIEKALQHSDDCITELVGQMKLLQKQMNDVLQQKKKKPRPLEDEDEDVETSEPPAKKKRSWIPFLFS